ncbi:MAG TPA: DUF456 family protein [Candidatus Krumholzibacteria bacterium]|nr:DUF456 family protein [Candidatus Krumholzibacteria bacterium]
MTQSIVLWSLAAILVVAGFIGVIAPVLPGAPLVFAGLVVAAWAENFQYVGITTLIIIAVLMGLTYVVDAIASALGVKRVGASRMAMAGAVLGTIAGVFFGLAGILLGPFIGAVAGELIARRDVVQAGKAGVAAWIGFIVGTLGKLAIMFTMVGVFVVKRLL